MKQLLVTIFFLISCIANAQIEKVIPPRPSPPRLVNDFTGTLTPEQRDALEYKLVAYNDSTSNQIAVVILNTISDYPLEDVSLGILRSWGVGGRENNNGVVLLVVKDDRKIRIETGYGLEGAIPDIIAKSIIENDLKPNFRSENYYRGLDEATDHLMQAAAGEYKAKPGSGNKKSKGIGFGVIFFIIILLLSLFGGRGGRGGGMASRRGYRGFGTGWIIGSILGSGGWTGGGGRGGGWSGGGGGFGGFGGGSGGGGGASGSW